MITPQKRAEYRALMRAAAERQMLAEQRAETSEHALRSCSVECARWKKRAIEAEARLKSLGIHGEMMLRRLDVVHAPGKKTIGDEK